MAFSMLRDFNPLKILLSVCTHMPWVERCSREMVSRRSNLQTLDAGSVADTKRRNNISLNTCLNASGLPTLDICLFRLLCSSHSMALTAFAKVGHGTRFLCHIIQEKLQHQDALRSARSM